MIALVSTTCAWYFDTSNTGSATLRAADFGGTLMVSYTPLTTLDLGSDAPGIDSSAAQEGGELIAGIASSASDSDDLSDPDTNAPADDTGSEMTSVSVGDPVEQTVSLENGEMIFEAPMGTLVENDQYSFVITSAGTVSKGFYLIYFNDSSAPASNTQVVKPGETFAFTVRMVAGESVRIVPCWGTPNDGNLLDANGEITSPGAKLSMENNAGVVTPDFVVTTPAPAVTQNPESDNGESMPNDDVSIPDGDVTGPGQNIATPEGGASTPDQDVSDMTPESADGEMQPVAEETQPVEQETVTDDEIRSDSDTEDRPMETEAVVPDGGDDLGVVEIVIS